jgi:hypothetical protein
MVLGAACLFLAVHTVVLYRSAQKLNAKLQEQQTLIDRANYGRQVVNGVLQDLARAAGTNVAIRGFLQARGMVQTMPVPVRPSPDAAQAPDRSAPASKGVQPPKHTVRK